jgi:hypothetical protein
MAKRPIEKRRDQRRHLVHIARAKDPRYLPAKRFINLRAFGQLNWGNPLRTCTRAIDIVQRGIDMYYSEHNTADKIKMLTDAERARSSTDIDPYSTELVDLIRETQQEQMTIHGAF